jgi:hypothetical protein
LHNIFSPRPALEAPGWAMKLCQDIVQWVEYLRRGPVPLTGYTVATLPDASKHARSVIYVGDESGGGVPAFSDGTAWRRVTDRAVVT